MTSHYHFLRLLEQCEVKITSLAHTVAAPSVVCARRHIKSEICDGCAACVNQLIMNTIS